MGSLGVHVTQRAGTDRPAFVAVESVVDSDGVPIKLSYLYAAMGLPERSSWHQTLLAICNSTEAAASVLHAAVNGMGFTLRRKNFRQKLDPMESDKSIKAEEHLLQSLALLGISVQD